MSTSAQETRAQVRSMNLMALESAAANGQAAEHDRSFVENARQVGGLLP